MTTNMQTSFSNDSSKMLGIFNTTNNKSECSNDLKSLHKYFPIEQYIYIYYMCPIAIIGIILNAISLRVFNAKSFNTTVTFKYLRIIARTDLFICLIVLGYCVSFYTPVFNRRDLYIRNAYLAYIYIPFANLSINLSMYLNLLVSIERLISVGWPTKKYTYFKPSRFILSCIMVLFGTISINLYLFFEYTVNYCQGFGIRDFTYSEWFITYTFIKEMISRVLPIAFLIIANIMLIVIVQSSRNRMKKKSKIRQNNEENTKCCAFGNLFKKRNNENNIGESNKNLIKTAAAKRNRQDNQLTQMTICVAILYIFCSVPMCLMILLPKVIYGDKIFEIYITQTYKALAAIANSLELLQCTLRFFIYYFFTTQFRIELKTIFNIPTIKQNSPIERDENLPLEKPVKISVKETNQHE